MKFGQNLYRYQVLEWTPFYIDYSSLKKLYKIASKTAVEQRRDADFADFTAALDYDLKRVESFYRTRHAVIQRSLNVLYNHYGLTDNTDLDDVNHYELEDLIAASTELRDALKQLQWYGVVNFNKIVGKLGKFRLGSIRHQATNDLGVSDTQLAIQAKCLRSITDLDGFLTKLYAKKLEASRSSSKRRSLFLERSYHEIRFPTTSLNGAYHAVDEDDASLLDQLIHERSYGDQESDLSMQRQLLLVLLHYSAIYGSKKCVVSLLSKTRFLEDYGDHLHWLIIKIGRRKKLQNRELNAQENTKLEKLATEAVVLLVYIINHLGDCSNYSLLEKDSFGRLPIHHAVYYGLFEVCQVILRYIGDQGEPLRATSSAALLPDSEGFTALHLAVITGNIAITELLLENHRHNTDTRKMGSPHSSLLPGTLLATAINSDVSEIAQLLCRHEIDVNYKGYNGETALYLAVRSGRADFVNMILEASKDHDQVNIDVHEAVYGRTPLIMACVRGDLPVMELLLRAGANPGTRDLFGWTAQDHAAFRGYLPIARRLIALDATPSSSISRISNVGSAKNDLRATERIRKANPTLDHAEVFREEVSSDYSQIFVNFGALDSYKKVTAVDLSPYVSPDNYTPQREADFQIEIRSVDGDDSSHVIQLPIMEDMANKPWRFLIKDPSKFKLVFNVFHAETNANRKDQFIGSALALLDNLKQGLGSKRESLIRDFTIPILQKNSLQFIGTVTFYFVVVTPFPHPHRISRIDHELWKHGSPVIIGHRGTGENDPSRKELQIGENTLQSFLSAADLGAPYIEFDVQLTKDNVPVIYHDFLMSETGIDAPLHNLSLEQFMHISNAQSSSGDLPSMSETRYLERCGARVGADHRSRSHSLNVYEQSSAKSLVERMKHTFEFKLKEPNGYAAFKGNTRSEYIQASFMTLEDLFVKLPESIKFDIEIKYPMLFEAHDWGMDTYAVEANLLVDSVLDNVYRLAGTRAVFFSSFSPEVCILLSRKQAVYPVFFLTESGHVPSADARAGSLQDAVHFARSWRLPGIISRSDPLVMRPELVGYVKDSGLLCVSWGGLNDDPDHAKTQAKEGLDAIITNRVRLISQALGAR